MSLEDSDLAETTRIWAREQAELQQRVVVEDDIPWFIPGSVDCVAKRPGGVEPLRRVGALDISFFPNSDSSVAREAAGGADGMPGVAALVVLSFPELEVLYEDCREVDLGIPYISGFLGFRECPAFLALLENVRGTNLEPQVLLVDGFGTLHPRQCGSASHLGVVSGLPTVGVGKTLVCIDGLSERSIRNQCAEEIARRQEKQDPHGISRRMPSAQSDAQLPEAARRDICLPMVGTESGEVRGMAVCKAGTTRPIFVSVGHRLSLETATELVLTCSRHKVPEPIRQADLRSREYVRQRQRPPDPRCS